MANALTGDFDAILQVSGGTVNRLIASMHQNSFADTARPSFPHSVKMRIGDTFAFEGVQGLAHCQVACPRVELVNGATDRFILTVAIRCWYRPDPGTELLPAYITGTVRAEYRLQDIPPSCLGWAHAGADTLWFRVVRESVTFDGTVDDDIDMLSIIVIPDGDVAARQAEMKARVKRQIARLLAKRFEAMPHKVSPRFRRGALRSLNAGGQSAIVAAVGLNGDPVGNIASVGNILLGGSDLAVAINRDYIMRVAQDAVNPIGSFGLTINIHVSTPWPAPDIDVTYHVGVNPPSITWQPMGNYALIKVRVSGWANTNSILSNATFDIDQDVILSFTDGFALSPGSGTIRVHTSGLYNGTVNDVVQSEIKKRLPKMVQDACNDANPQLATLTQQTGELEDRLRSLDAKSRLSLDWAEFQDAGIVVHGTIALSPRKAPVIQQSTVPAGNAHTALESWIPGGRIDRFEWGWTWSGTNETGARKFTDRFLLQRPWAERGRWGISFAKDPLPGLDGWGTVCLRIVGVTTDPVTGDLVPVVTERRCRRFGFIMTALIGDEIKFKKPPLLRDFPELPPAGPHPEWRERGIVAAGRNPALSGQVNTLVALVDADHGPDAVKVIIDGLEACRRYDAGVTALILFREGALDSLGADHAAELEGKLREAGIPGHVNEDVGATWAETLGIPELPEGLAFALITPEGTVPWKAQNLSATEGLGVVLDDHLRRAADHKPTGYSPKIPVGWRLSAALQTFDLGDILDLEESPCPPIPTAQLAAKDKVFAFAHIGSESSLANLHNVAKTYGGEETAVVAIIEGATPEQASALQRQRGLDIIAVPDPQGKVGDQFGVDVFPTTLLIGADGVVSDVLVGLGAHHPDNRAPQSAAGRDRAVRATR
jgi:hypothetical protein